MCVWHLGCLKKKKNKKRINEEKWQSEIEKKNLDCEMENATILLEWRKFLLSADPSGNKVCWMLQLKNLNC